MNWSYFIPPLIGAVIGYCTNYIAVKMLFLPRREIRVFGHRLPLTPGAIPKGKERLAKAVGNTVNERLLTQSDIIDRLLQPETVESITDRLMEITEKTVKEAGTELAGDNERYEELRNGLSGRLTEEIYASAEEIPFSDLIAARAGEILQKMTSGTMLQMFMTEEMIRSVVDPVGKEIDRYLQENGREYIDREVKEKLIVIENRSLTEVTEEVGLEVDSIRSRIRDLYCGIIRNGAEPFLQKLDIAGMIETKINEMDVLELEKLVLDVMKKELNTIVGLGALIGLILGSLNLLF